MQKPLVLIVHSSENWLCCGRGPMANIHILNQLEVCCPEADGVRILEFTLQSRKLLIESLFPVVCHLISLSGLICTSSTSVPSNKSVGRRAIFRNMTCFEKRVIAVYNEVFLPDDKL